MTALPGVSYASAAPEFSAEYAGDATGFTDYYIIQFNEPALASYRGSVAGLRAPPRLAGTGRNKLDPHASESLDYVRYLETKQQAFLRSAGLQAGAVLFAYQHAFNGIAIRIDAEQAARIARMPGVSAVTRGREYRLNSDAGPSWIGAPTIWGCHPASGGDSLFANGFDDAGNGGGSSLIDCTVDGSDGLPHSKGEGVVIGVIDGGVNFASPSFAGTGGDGYTHTNPLGGGTYLGSCAPGKPDAGKCNDKLIGAWGFVGGTPANPATAVDTFGHGAHTASTAGGNYTTIDYDGARVNLSGVAPHANIIVYKGCAGQTCDGAALLASINQVLADGEADIVNYSISGGSSPWGDPISQGFLSATDAGVFVAAAAGNTNDSVPTPVPGSAHHLEPWTTGVANLSHDRLIGDAQISVDGLGAKNGILAEGPSFSAPINAPLRVSSNLRACTAGGGFAGGPFPAGFIALVERGDCEFTMKINNAKAAGAAAVVVFQNSGAAPIPMGASTTLPAPTVPALMVSQSDGQAIVAALTGNPALTGTANKSTPPLFSHDPGFADVQSESSLLGPAPFDTLQPDIGAPGTNILAAINGDATSYGLMSGTSMASPHVAGSGALVKALHPDWSPMEIKSALMLTSRQGVRKALTLAPADPFDTGAGRVDLNRAAATPLVMDETAANMAAANPASGGKPRNLNLASLQDKECRGTCTFTRTVRSVSDATESFSTGFNGASGLSVNVSPASFSIAPGATQELTISVNASGATINAWAFGTLELTPAGDEALRMPVAIKPQAAATTPTIAVAPTSLSSTQATNTTATKTLTVSNTGGGSLNWSLAATATAALWDQPKSGDNGILSDYSSTDNQGAYTAADFQIANASAIRKIKAYGFDNTDSLGNQTGITWRIYGNASGQPNGNPATNTGTPVWSYTAAPNSPGVTLTDGETINLDLAAAGESLNLPTGTYWLTVYPTYANAIGPATNPRWNWFQAAQRNAAGMLLWPENGVANWTTVGSLTSGSIVDVAFTIEGDIACGAPWLALSPASGNTAAGASSAVTATFNSTGLADGSYSATACIASNDAARPLVTVPVSLTVQPDGGDSCPSQILLDPGFEATNASYQNPNWDSTSANGESSLCSNACSSGPGSLAHAGEYFVWFGGWGAVEETGTASQQVVIPNGEDRFLNFWLRRDAGVAATSQMTVSIDGTVLSTIPRGTGNETAYAPYALPVPANFADGNAHTVEFEFSKTGAGEMANFFVDDVSLDCSAQPTSTGNRNVSQGTPLQRTRH